MENTISILIIPILTVLIGCVIGPFLSAWLVYWFRDRKLNEVRKIAIKALVLFEKYDKKSFREASNEFLIMRRVHFAYISNPSHGAI